MEMLIHAFTVKILSLKLHETWNIGYGDNSYNLFNGKEVMGSYGHGILVAATSFPWEYRLKSYSYDTIIDIFGRGPVANTESHVEL